MTDNTVTLVIGHLNPDMDAIASAVGYAWLLNQGNTGRYIAGRPGDINKQTAFALQRFSAEAPPLVTDVNVDFPGEAGQTPRLVLVDHNEPIQVVAGGADADVVGILDHHRLNSVATSAPIFVHIEPVGSTATLVTELAIAQGLTLPPEVAGLLLCGILSDTMVFRSPPTPP